MKDRELMRIDKYERNNYPELQEQMPRRSKRPRKQGMKGMAAVLALSVMLSGVAGFGGGYLASQMNQTEADESTGVSASNVSYVQTASTSGSMSVADVAEKTADSVVEITTETVTTNGWMGQMVESGAGSGVIISEDGYIVTNNHVIEDASKITVRLRNGQEYAATLVGTDAKTDVAVIKIEATGLQAAVMGDSDSLRVGETAVVIGNPLGELGGTVTEGIISALDREIQLGDEYMTLLQTDAAINPGNSGGGLFNDRGELVGIVVAKTSAEGIEGLGFAIPINIAKDVIGQLETNGYVSGRADLGMDLVDVSSIQTAWQYGVSSTGVYVQKLTNTISQQAGFQPGDRIVAINGTEVSSVAEVNKILDSCQIGDQVEVTVIRGRQQGTLTMTLPEYQPGSSAQVA